MRGGGKDGAVGAQRHGSAPAAVAGSPPRLRCAPSARTAMAQRAALYRAGWHAGQKYVLRAMSPCRKRSTGVPQSRHGFPRRL